MERAYSFFKFEPTGEKHIFESEFTPYACNVSDVSICNKIDKSQGAWIETCLAEQRAREKAAEFGRGVCCECVNHLYKSI